MLMGDAEQATRRLMSSIPDTDKAVIYTSPHAEVFVNSVREGYRPGSQGVAHDDILINQEWGFDLASVKPRIDIWHGEADVNVPLHAAEYLRDLIPRSRATFLPGEGHFFLLKRWEEVLVALVSENEG
jgi:pimeloyl-ACP methyl ester carboxylesterase